MSIPEAIVAFLERLFKHEDIQGLTITYTYCSCEYCLERELPLRTFEVIVEGQSIKEVFEIRIADLRNGKTKYRCN